MLKLIAGLAFVYVAGFVAFVATLPRTQPQGPHADGIVVLTGGNERLAAAVRLLERGAAKRLLITGVNDSTTKAELKLLAHGTKRFDCCADLGYAAVDTHGNALETAAWTHRHHYRSIIVVTASYHMPRSLTEFSAAMPDVTLVAYPVAPAGAHASSWPTPGMLHLLHSEYVKYLASVVITQFQKPDRSAALDRESAPRESHATT